MIFIVYNSAACKHVYCAVYINVNCNIQGTFAFCTVYCKNAVWLNLIQRFCIIPVHLICRHLCSLLFCLSIRNDSLCLNVSFAHVKVMNGRTVVCVLAYAFCKNILCTVKCVSSSFHIKGRIFIVCLNVFFCFFFNF